jgi:ABC-type Mn2+/Zn2+ transport system permease subunit
VNTRLWSFLLNLTIGLTAAAAVQAIGALPTFALLTWPAVAALRLTSSVRATFATAGVLSVVLPTLALAAAFYLDLPAGPATVALLAIGVPLAAVISGFADTWRRRRPAHGPTAAARHGLPRGTGLALPPNRSL